MAAEHRLPRRTLAEGGMQGTQRGNAGNAATKTGQRTFNAEVAEVFTSDYPGSRSAIQPSQRMWIAPIEDRNDPTESDCKEHLP